MEDVQSHPNPFLRATVWSRVSLSWIVDLINISHKQGRLYFHNLYDILPQHKSKLLTGKLEKRWLDEVHHHEDSASLLRATAHTIRWTPILIGFILIPLKIAMILQPLLIIYMMKYFEPCSTMSTSLAYLLAVFSFLLFLSSSFCHHAFYYLIDIFAMKVRVAYQGLIYQKVLRLSTHSLNAFGSGQITNVFSNDATQIEMALISMNFLWNALTDIIAMTFLFWYFIEYITLVAIGYTIITVFITFVIGHFLVHFRIKVLKVADERIKIMSEVIRSMRLIKMYCWEVALNRNISRIRKHEIIRYIFILILNTISVTLSNIYSHMTFLIMYALMWSRGIQIGIQFFTVASCMLTYFEVSLIEFGIGIRDIAHYLSAERRMNKFLLLDESERDNRLKSTVDDESVRIECQLERAYWNQNGTFSLQNILFHARPGDLICIIGPVGSGKSSLLQTLTGEITYFDGKVRLNGSFCYVPQESWIFSSTIKNNILFGKEYDNQLFRRVIHAAALDTDCDQLPDGIQTMVGDQGVMLSGGQKARVNMARALYREADIYLLDDPLSAVDTKVSKYLFERCIRDYLRDKICVLVTHQIQFLQDATKIIMLDNGEMVHTGTYSELLTCSPLFSQMLHNINQQECTNDSKKIQTAATFSRMASSGSTDETEESLLTDHIEMHEKGSVKWHVYLDYIRASSGVFIGIALLLIAFGIREFLSIFATWWLAEWSEDENHRHIQYANCTDTKDKKMNAIKLMNETEWNNHHNRKFYFYCITVFILTILTLLRTITLQSLCLNASRMLHNRMFQRLIRCPIAFFDLNPIGRILNRFTKDIALIDEQLPNTIFDFMHCFFVAVGMMAFVSWLNPWSLIPASIASIGMLYIRYQYATCSRDLKRLEGTTRSPFYSYLASTINGLKVIRSYHAEQMCSNEFFQHLDDNTRVNFLLTVTNRWAAIRFEAITLFFIVVVTLLALFVRTTGGHFSTANIALTLSNAVNLVGLLQWTIRQSVEVETQMTSVERILDYCSLQQEQSSLKSSPPSNWPQHGRIIFNNVSMSHSSQPHAPLALHNISFTIEPAQKIGIVGRTGSGKSSLIQTLFRMATLVDGHIIIDDIDITTLPLDRLRQRLSIIPQDPVLFTGTIRSNLDQFGRYSDAEIWNALEQVQLKKLVREVLPDGLQSHVSESGSNLSVGQKQLMCLARAILKKSKILVIDEATANVDNATDELIQKAIREQFAGCTVLTVAHRLRTVIDSDRVMVLSDGKVVEFDSAKALLSNGDSYFSELVKQTGPAEAERLYELAKQKFIQ
ncbi:unnamed protein product [Adineta ricciae]|uniref:Uncharacterized protein n=1 Tax=Adineta ricciae TaxID=249248 RepID=A0A813T8G6_ADIRI|nr:unnamed protein product [Adineta ricciae]